MIVEKRALHDALRQLQHAIDRHARTPILSGVHLSASDGTLVLTATDLTIWLRVTVPCDGLDLQACVPARPLLDFTKPSDRVDGDAAVEIAPANETQVRVTASCAETVLDVLPVRDFPVHPAATIEHAAWRDEATWDASIFKAVLGWVIRAAGTDATRPHLTTVLLDNEAAVATDGHRLHLARLEGMNSGPTVVPARAVATLVRILPDAGSVVATRAKDLLRFSADELELAVRVVTEAFPPYEQILPPPGAERFHVVFERGRLDEALKRLPNPRGARSAGVTMRINAQLHLERRTDIGSVSATIRVVECTHHEPAEFEIGVNARHLTDAIASTDRVLTARFGGVLDPIRIEPSENQIAVLMPLRT
jgi:DNA polymerase III subunit beta